MAQKTDIYTCVRCNKDFYRITAPGQTTPKFCTTGCREEFGSGDPVLRNCSYCKTQFRVPKNYLNKRFCNLACSNKSRTGMKLKKPHKKDQQIPVLEQSGLYKFNCATCNEPVERFLSKNHRVPRFCERKCIRWEASVPKMELVSTYNKPDKVHKKLENIKPIKRQYINKQHSYTDTTVPEQTQAYSKIAVLISVINLLGLIYIILCGSNLNASEQCDAYHEFYDSKGNRMCRSPQMENVRLALLREEMKYAAETDVALPVSPITVKPPQRQPSPLAVLQEDEK